MRKYYILVFLTFFSFSEIFSQIKPPSEQAPDRKITELSDVILKQKLAEDAKSREKSGSGNSENNFKESSSIQLNTSSLKVKNRLLNSPDQNILSGVHMNEAEPNNSFSTANAIPSNPIKIKGNVFPNADVDWYSFTATAGEKVYAAVITSFSANGSSDSQLRLIASDGTTVIEFDDDGGSFGGLSSSIAGAVIPSNGTYYLQVNHFSATGQLRGYDLYFKTQSGVPTPEVESNDTAGTANALPATGWVSGARNPALASEQDWFSITLAAGQTIFISMDLDPERDAIQYNGRIGVAHFGDADNQILVADDANSDAIGSEALVFTAKNAGTYYVYADAASAATGGPTATYNISVSTFAATPGYVNYPSADIPKAIGPSAGSITSTITIPDSKLIKDISIRIELNHTLMADVDALLTTPNGNKIHLFTDIGATATGGQIQMDAVFNDNNGLPPVFTVLKGVAIQPELNCKLDMLKGGNAAGVWTLTLYDDLTNASGGTLTNWSIDILEDVPPSLVGLTAIVNENFESTDGGFTHSGSFDEWEYGTPATIETTSIAGFTTANSGTKCWKTDLDNTYDINSDQTLTSPIYNLTAFMAPIWLSWASKFQIENATFDNLEIWVEEEGNPTNKQMLFTWLGATPTASVGSPATTVALSTPWGTFWVNISAFAGKQIRFKINLKSDASINYGGIALDDVKIYGTPLCTPSSITLGVNPTVCTGSTSANLAYTATTGSPNRYNIDYNAAAEAAGFVDVVNAVLPSTPIVLVVPGAAPAAVYNATITVQNNVGGCLSSVVPFTVTTVACIFPCVETFDAVVTPALPVGWVATSGATTCVGPTFSTPWETTAAASASAPNAAFTNDPGCISDENLDTRTYAISASGTSQLKFNLNYSLEGNAGNSTGFDGMVLEMSINAGPFADIITAGGTFVANGYTHTISPSFLSPIGGRDAWSGNSPGWLASTVNLPVAANGQNVVFRFRRATDNSVSRVGVWIDDVHVIQVATISYAGTPYCSNAGTASVTLTGSTGGTYSASPAGLSLNPATGAVTLGTSTPGSYTVTYSLSSGAGCPVFTTTAPITITALPVATISYAANPYCQSGGTANVTRTGPAGGIYSSTAGLSINAGTGAVTLGTSNTGTYTVTYTIAAAAGCPAVMTTTSITINSNPVITCPANISMNSTAGMCGANVTYPAATATGVPTPTITYSKASGTFFPVGVTTVTATATNICGSTSCTFTVTVLDIEPPVITCPANITASNTPGLCSAVVSYTAPTATDNCAPNGTLSDFSIPWTSTGQRGVYFDVKNEGANPITINRLDPAMWGATAINDVFSVYFTTSANTWNGSETNAGAWTLNTNANVSFPGGANPVQVPINLATPIVLGPGQSKGVYVVGAQSFGGGPVAYISTGAGYVGPQTFTDGTLRFTGGVGCSGLFTGIFGTGAPGNFRLYYGSVTYISATSTVQIAGIPSGGIFPVGTTTNTFRATDGAGLTATCSFTVTVNDTESPTITCPAAVVRNTDPAVCTATFAPVNPTAADNCGVTVQTWAITGATTANSAATGINTVGSRAFNLGVSTITYTVRDAAGNSRTCTQTITINDGQLPTITTQPANRTLCVGGTATFSVAAVTAPTAGGPLSYQWQIWNGTAWVSVTGATGATTNTMTLSNVTHSMNTNSYRVQVTGLCTIVNSNFATLFVNPLPTITLTTSIPPALIPTQVLTITATPSSAGGSYVWSKNGVVIVGATSSILNNLTVNDLGTYSVVYTDANGCVVTSSNIVITALPSDNLYVYPVPNRGVFNVRFYNQTNEEATIRVFDMKGSEVYQRKMPTTQPYTTMIVDLTTGRILTSGPYVVEVRGAAGRLIGTRKIIVNK